MQLCFINVTSGNTLRKKEVHWETKDKGHTHASATHLTPTPTNPSSEYFWEIPSGSLANLFTPVLWVINLARDKRFEIVERRQKCSRGSDEKASKEGVTNMCKIYF
jgi:hypothetical protein